MHYRSAVYGAVSYEAQGVWGNRAVDCLAGNGSREWDTPDFPDDSVYGGGFQADQVRGQYCDHVFHLDAAGYDSSGSACLCGGLRR